MRLTVAVLDKNGAEVSSKIIEALASCAGASDFCVATASEVVRAKKIEALAQRLAAPLGLGFATSKRSRKPEVMKIEGKTAVFEGAVYEPKLASVLEVVAKNVGGDAVYGAKALMETVEGDFALIVAEADRLVVARDPVGVEPLYYGENSQVAAVASNRKALWRLGVNCPKSFPPGNVAVVNRGGFTFQPVKVLRYSDPASINLDDAAVKLQGLLEKSVQLRLGGVRKVAVAFSGGLDSSVVAFLAKKCGVEVQLIHVSLENQPETEDAWKAAEELGLPLEVHLFKEADVERVVHEVVGLIEDADPLKASVGVPFYWVAEKAVESGFRVLLAGQGADELFGGYQRYVNEYLTVGEESVRRAIYRDVTSIHENNIERDKKICGFHGVELRLPFASYPIAEFALSLPTELKFEKKQDCPRKIVLRKAAQLMGLSETIVWKPKKAVQYGTGVSNALKKIAKKEKVTLVEYIEKIFLAR
ncbi:MAG: DUF7411 family protein [Candidatus Bathyarchaeia archaeon]